MGVARGGATGDLTIRGSSSEQTSVAPAGSTAFYNSAPFAGDLAIEQLTVTGAAAGAGVSGVKLQQWTGDLAVIEAIFERLSDAAIDVTGLTGDVWLQSNLFDRVGDNVQDAAVRLSEVSGAGVISGNDFNDGMGAAMLLSSGGERTATWLVDDNAIEGDGSLFSTTHTGMRVQLAGQSLTDVILDHNTFEGLAGPALDFDVQDQAALQTRWSVNWATNLKGSAAAQVALRDAASAALLAESNTWNDMFGSGVTMHLEDAADLRAIIQYDAFTSIGDGQGDTPDEALTIGTAAGATGDVNLFLFNNTFSTVSGNGLRIAADGQAAVRAVIRDNAFDEANTTTPGAALVVEHASAAAQASIDLQLENNSTFRHQDGGYLLQQRGTAVMRLEGEAATAAAQIADQNWGEPVTVTGTVAMIAAGSLDTSLPLLLGDTVWRDDGDGLQNLGEEGVAGIVIHLSGIETDGGAAVTRITQSDAAGTYLFPALAAGTYTLTLDVPFAMRLATANQGVDDATDNDFDAASTQAVVMLASPNDDMTVDAGLWGTWQNPRNPLDVNDDGQVIPLDALVLINDINARAPRSLPIPPVPPSVPPPYLDVSGNGDVAPQDVLMVINYLNGATAGGAGEGEAVELAGSSFGELSSAPTWASHGNPARRRAETDADSVVRGSPDPALAMTDRSQESGRPVIGRFGEVGRPAPNATHGRHAPSATLVDELDAWFTRLGTASELAPILESL